MSKPLTPQGIDRLLRKAGHPRHDHRTGMYAVSIGYTVNDGGSGLVTVCWDNGPDGDPEPIWDALWALAATLTEAGYTGERGEYVTAAGGEAFRWPCLIVTTGEDTPDA